MKKHSEVCPASGFNKSVFSCHICETEYESSHHLNAHYSLHYKEELKAKIASDTSGMSVWIMDFKFQLSFNICANMDTVERRKPD